MNNQALPRIYIYRQIVEAKLYIDAHFDEKMSLDKIAKQACISKFHFHRIFKECYGKTPLEYLTYLRIKKAKELLATQVKTAEVCEQVGYSSVSSFIKLFKKKEGISPVLYAQMIFSKQNESHQSPLTYIPVGFAEYLGWNLK